MAHARLAARTLLVVDALGPTAGDGVTARVALAAHAYRYAVLDLAVGVRSARIREAGCGRRRPRDWLLGRRPARHERITFVAVRTVAHRHVRLHPAVGAETADTWARIHALVALTGLGAIAIGVALTLGPTALVRVAEEFRQAAAHADVVVDAALSVLATFARVTWIPRLGRRRRGCNENIGCQ